MRKNRLNPLVRTFTACGVFLLSLTVLTAMGAAKETTTGMDEMRIERAVSRLQLNTYQKDAVARIMEDFIASTEAVLDNYNVDLENARPPLGDLNDLRSDMKQNFVELEQQMTRLLSPEQMQEFRKIQREQIQERRALLQLITN